MRVLRFAAIVALLTTGVLALPRSNSKGVDVSALQIRDAGEALDVVAEAISDFESTVDVKEAQLNDDLDSFSVSDTSGGKKYLEHLQHIANKAASAGNIIDAALSGAPSMLTHEQAEKLEKHALKLDPVATKIKNMFDNIFHHPATKDSSKLAEKKTGILEGLEKMLNPLKGFTDLLNPLTKGDPISNLKHIIDEIIAKIKGTLGKI